MEKIWNPQMIFDFHSVQAGVRNELGRVLVVSVLRREWNDKNEGLDAPERNV